MSVSNLLHPNNDTLYCGELNSDSLNIDTLSASGIQAETIVGTTSGTFGQIGFSNNVTLTGLPTGGGALITTAVSFYKFTSNMCMISIPGHTDNTGTGVNYINFSVGTIPTLYRPSVDAYVSIPIISDNNKINGLIELKSDGSILIVNPSGNFSANKYNGWAPFVAFYVL